MAPVTVGNKNRFCACTNPYKLNFLQSAAHKFFPQNNCVLFILFDNNKNTIENAKRSKLACKEYFINLTISSIHRMLSHWEVF